MGRRYKQLSLEERYEVARLQAEGCSVQQIAAGLDRTPSTISRELKRNRGVEVGYKPSYAQEQASGSYTSRLCSTAAPAKDENSGCGTNGLHTLLVDCPQPGSAMTAQTRRQEPDRDVSLYLMCGSEAVSRHSASVSRPQS